MKRIVSLSVLLLSAVLFTVPAVLPAQTPPAAPQSPAEKAATDELNQINIEGGQAYSKGNLSAALKAFQVGLDKAQTLKNEKYAANFFNNLAVVYADLGQYDKALVCDQQALTLREKAGNPTDIGGSYNNLGIVYAALGKNDKALEYYQKDLTIEEKIGNTQQIAYLLSNIGLVYSDLGQYDKALDCHQRALPIFEKIGNLADTAGSLNNIGTVYYSLGQNDKALDYYQQALILQEKSGNPAEILIGFSNLGTIYDALGQFDKALYYNQQALDIREKIGNPQETAISLNNIGNVYYHLGQNDKALAVYQQALTLQEKINNPQDIAHSFNSIGGIYCALGQNAKALEFYQRSLTLREKIGNPKYNVESLENIGSVYVDMKQWNKAEDAYSRARRTFENFSQQVGDPTELADLQQSLPHLYEQYANVLIQEKKPDDALAVFEAGRARGLSRQVALNGSNYTAVFTADEKNLLKQNTDALAAASSLLHGTEARLADCKPEQKAAVQKQKDEYQKKQADTEQKYTTYRDTLFAHYPQFREVSGERPPTVAEFKSLARKNPDTLYLTWAILDDKSTLLFALSDKDGLKTYSLPVGEKGLQKMAANWQVYLVESAQGKDPDAPPGKAEEKQAKALYQALFAPLEKYGLMKPGRYRRIVTVSTGPLLAIPYAALEAANGKRLIETHAVSAAIALGVFFWRDNPNTPKSDLLCIADPYGDKATGQELSLRRGGAMKPLPAAREEGRQIAGLFAKESLLIGPAARKAEVLKALPDAKFLHFATHGYFNDKSPFLSGLVLAPEPEGSHDDGVLSAREILNTPLAARIAVLSACETGRGKAEGGEGLLGLAWAFRAAGCPCVVASQWQVEDNATRDLMLTFYKGLLAGKRKDDALRSAMLAVKKAKPSPFYWAAFQVIGDTARL